MTARLANLHGPGGKAAAPLLPGGPADPPPGVLPPPPDTARAIAPADLDRLMPLHAILTPEGNLAAAGPTLIKLFPAEHVLGKPFLGLFEARGTGWIADMAGLAAQAGQKLHLSPRSMAAGLRLRGVLVPLAGGGFLVNLSFGIDVVRAVGLLQLTDMDFAPTDLAMELLYLAEANAAVRGEMRELSRRLVGARLQAQEEAQTDPLTGLRNRRACDSFLARLCRERAPFALMQIDLDHFKQVNDRLGHAAGDHVLKHMAQVLTAQARVMDCLARVGGDEFMVLLPGLVDATRLMAMGERIIAQVSQPIPFGEEFCHVSASIGFAIVHEGLGPDPAAALAEADIMLYAAKEGGRGRVMGTRIER
jgi:diguanylate cyclase (GGDEF)-like protein